MKRKRNDEDILLGSDDGNERPRKKPRIFFERSENPASSRVKSFLEMANTKKEESLSQKGKIVIDKVDSESEDDEDEDEDDDESEEEEETVEMKLILGVLEEKTNDPLIVDEDEDDEDVKTKKKKSNTQQPKNESVIRLSSEATPREKKEMVENTRTILKIMKFMLPKDKDKKKESKEKKSRED